MTGPAASSERATELSAPRDRASEPFAPSDRVSRSQPPDPARAYKDVVAGLTAAADELRERDREREVVLGQKLVELGEARAQAEERAKRSEKAACRYWEAALAAVWTGSGMKMRPLPRPDRWADPADPADLDDLDAQVERRIEELHHALHRRWRPHAL